MLRAIAVASVTFFVGSFVVAAFVMAFAKFCGVEMGEASRGFVMMMILTLMPFAAGAAGICVYEHEVKRRSFPR